MKNKIRYLILIIVLMIIPILTLGHEVKTKASYLNLIMLSNGEIVDLPDEDTTNTYNINRYIFCKYNYGSGTEYLLNYYSTTTTYNILYTTEKFTNDSIIEWEDDEFADIYNADLKTLLLDLKSMIKEITPSYNDNQQYFIQYSYIDSIGYWRTTQNKPLLYNNNYSGNFDTGIITEYINHYGILNSIYQQNNLYKSINNYYNTLLLLNSESIEAYEQALTDQQDYYQQVISSINKDWLETIHEEQTNYYNNGYEQGYIDGQNNPVDDIHYDLNYMFNAISLYPIHFFTEGLDVNLFGINLGELILGIFMLALLIIIIRMVITIIRGRN